MAEINKPSAPFTKETYSGQASCSLEKNSGHRGKWEAILYTFFFFVLAQTVLGTGWFIMFSEKETFITKKSSLVHLH